MFFLAAGAAGGGDGPDRAATLAVAEAAASAIRPHLPPRHHPGWIVFTFFLI